MLKRQSDLSPKVLAARLLEFIIEESNTIGRCPINKLDALSYLPNELKKGLQLLQENGYVQLDADAVIVKIN